MNVPYIIRIAIAIGYILLGIAILVFQKSLTFLSVELRIAFAILLLIYGIFRAYRAYHLYKEN